MRNTFKRKSLLIFCLFFAGVSFAQSPLYKGADASFDKHIKTIQLRKLGGEMTDPVIELGSGERLLLTFDDLSNSARHFTYKVVLCNADWNESDLFTSEYLEGFHDDYISDRQSSFGTLVGYEHYRLEFPNSQMQVKLSGNYLLKVYESGNLNEVLFQRSFSVVERTSLNVRVSIRHTPLAGSEPCTQQLDFTVEHPSFSIQQPHTELKVRVEQNGYRLAQVPLPSPTFIRNGVIDFSHYNKNRYIGSSEYRHFDISSLEYRTLRVRSIENVDGVYRVQVEEDIPFRQYLFYNDINGRYVIRNERYKDYSSTQSDYANVFLSLRMPQPLSGKVYVFGELTGWELSNDNLMRYDVRRQAYEISLLVKQGYYNYKYVYVDENGKVDMGRIDACSHAAENTYGIFAYYRGIGNRHDRLANVTWINSRSSMEK